MFALEVPNLNLVPAQAHDAQALFTLYRDCIRPHLERAFGWDDAQQHERFHSRYTLENFLWIDGKERMGTLYLQEKPGRIHLSLLLIDAPFRNAGLGSQVIQAIIEQASPRDVSLSVTKENPALKLYEKLGFQITGEDTWFYDMVLNQPQK